MKNGHWIPISKGFLKALPHDREYTELEAAYSLQVDYDCKNEVTVAGYSDLWRWSRGKVYRFLKRMNIEIKYPEDTTKKQNQNGQIAVQITDRSRTDHGQIRLIENSYLQEEKNRSRTDNGQITDRSQYTTIEPKDSTLKPKGKKKEEFLSDSIEYRLANYLLKFILQRNPGHKKPDLQKWAKEIGSMISLDKRDPEDIKKIIKWCQEDIPDKQTRGTWKGWANNILSTKKLREKFDKLFIKMQESKVATRSIQPNLVPQTCAQEKYVEQGDIAKLALALRKKNEERRLMNYEDNTEGNNSPENIGTKLYLPESTTD